MFTSLGVFFLVSLISAKLHIRPLPAGISLEGQRTEGWEPDDGDVISCARHWYDRPPPAILYDSKTNMCTSLEKVYGSKAAPEGESAYLLTQGDSNVCAVNATEDITNILSCREGWKQLSLTHSDACYHTMSTEEYEKYTPNRWQFIDACKQDFPFADAASIHSREEELLIAQNFNEEAAALDNETRAGNYNFWGLKIGLRLDHPKEHADFSKWYWIDGTPVDYSSFNAANMYAYCTDIPCSHATLYWTVSDVMMSGSDKNTKPLLCKYTLRTK